MELKNKSLFKEKCFIGGEWINSLNDNRIEVDNPATQQLIGSVPECGKRETENAIKVANAAFLNWKNKTAKERSIVLKQWQDLIIKIC
jgi:NAD-dependent aldehyde dehydrogenases